MRSAADLLGSGFVFTFNHYFTSCSDVSLVARGLNLALPRHQALPDGGLFLRRGWHPPSFSDGVFGLGEYLKAKTAS